MTDVIETVICHSPGVLYIFGMIHHCLNATQLACRDNVFSAEACLDVQSNIRQHHGCVCDRLTCFLLRCHVLHS